MITTERKYPTSVKEIHILGSGARECKKVVIDVEEDRPRRVSKRYRDLESEIRAVSQASRRYHDTYLELHDASNEEKKNGSLKDLPDNVLDAREAAWKSWRKNSRVYKNQKRWARKAVDWNWKLVRVFTLV